jgi:hypothetical protein
MLTILQRAIHWLVSNEGVTSSAEEADTYGSWHGDHWHNLLCSPMDARHYVMEDWSLQPEPPHANAK